MWKKKSPGFINMDDKKFEEMAKFEETHDCTVISPKLSQIMNDTLPGEGYDYVQRKQQFFYVVLQNQEGKIIDITHYSDYDVALMRGMEKSKETGNYWSIFSLAGKFVDGNFSIK